jgi:nucleotide-binding universal stress UspA family protein
MQVYRKILVAIDCSPVDDAIIEHVAALALQNSAKVYLLHVVHSHTLDQNRVLTEKARVTMAGYRATLEAQGVEAFVLLRSGEPDPEILAEIENADYDLVAMATHGHTFLGDLLFGSVSRTLKHRIQIPLLLLKPDRRGHGRKKRS